MLKKFLAGALLSVAALTVPGCTGQTRAPTTVTASASTVTASASTVTVTVAPPSPSPSAEPVAASAEYGDGVYGVGHAQPGLDKIIPPGLYRAVPVDPVMISLVQRCSSVLCGGGQIDSQIGATMAVPGGSVVSILGTDTAVALVNATLTGPLG